MDRAVSYSAPVLADERRRRAGQPGRRPAVLRSLRARGHQHLARRHELVRRLGDQSNTRRAGERGRAGARSGRRVDSGGHAPYTEYLQFPRRRQRRRRGAHDLLRLPRRRATPTCSAFPSARPTCRGAKTTVSTGTPNQRTPAFAEGPDGQIALAFISETTGDDRILVSFPFVRRPADDARADRRGTRRGPGQARHRLERVGLHDRVERLQREGAAHERPDGTFIDAAPIDVMPGFNVDVAALGQNFCVIASNRSSPIRSTSRCTTAASTASPARCSMARPSWSATSYAYNARIHPDGARWIATWERHPTHDDPQSSAQYSFISADGSHTPEASVNSPFTSRGGQPDVAMSGSHRCSCGGRTPSPTRTTTFAAGS